MKQVGPLPRIGPVHKSDGVALAAAESTIISAGKGYASVEAVTDLLRKDAYQAPIFVADNGKKKVLSQMALKKNLSFTCSRHI